MKKTLLLFCILAFTFFSCCNDDDQFVDPFIDCCNNSYEPIVVFDSVNIYIPNAFSPNQDGINDRFVVFYGGNGFQRADSLWVKDLDGNVLYEVADFDLNSFPSAWNGFLDGPEEPYLGAFNYGLKVSLPQLGVEEMIEGIAWSVPCGEVLDPYDLSNIGNCWWGTQHDGLGGFDPNADSMEDDCL